MSLVKPFETSSLSSLGQGRLISTPSKTLIPLSVWGNLPPTGDFKLNVNGSLVSSSGLAGGEDLLHDSTGLVSFANSYGHNIIMALKLLALIKGVKLFVNRGCMDFMIESDSQALCRMILGETAYPWHLDA
ncbi:hypothetical protein ACH5RR_037124 [Cinchona calisaya]|uniref:RNase H type-1 domain-containing protein n=1 Tax=Cinchona calisaya TaxID=153742 RepID=A0ABD2YA22_9GENT